MGFMDKLGKLGNFEELGNKLNEKIAVLKEGRNAPHRAQIVLKACAFKAHSVADNVSVAVVVALCKAREKRLVGLFYFIVKCTS